MFFSWSLAEAWEWFVHLPFLGGLVLCSPLLAIAAVNLAAERR